MPNICLNTLVVAGAPEDLNRFRTHAKNGTDLNFSQFIPEPKMTDAGERQDWRAAKWGTKWNAKEIEVTKDRGEGYYSLTYKFDTAWAPPIEVVHKMQEMYPDLVINLEYEEGSIGFKGRVWSNGDIEEQDL